MSTNLDQLMERASQALARMAYLECEQLCLEALAQARQSRDWVYYARVLLPLQETRRQKRMIAAEGMIRLGTDNLKEDAESLIQAHSASCIVVTHPHQAEAARALDRLARKHQKYVEVLFADNNCEAGRWRLTSFTDLKVSCEIAGPPSSCRDCWLSAGHPITDPSVKPIANPADWFVNATEQLGDAALAEIDVSISGLDRLAAVEQCLEVVTDHELIHQHLGSVVSQMQHQVIRDGVN